MIIFLYGEDSFRSHQKMIEIKNKYLESDKSGSGLSSFDAKDKILPRDIITVFEMPNLLAPKRLVMIKRFISDANEFSQKEMLGYLKKNQQRILADTDLVVIFWEENAPRKNNALFKFLDENAKRQNFEKLTGSKLNGWILKQISEVDKSVSMSNIALEKLIAYVGSNTAALDSEVKKLVNHSCQNKIEESDVDAVTRANIDTNIFKTIDAIASKNKQEALNLLHNHLSMGDDPFYILSMFVYQFRNLIKIADLKEQGIGNDYELAKISKLHPFVIKKSAAQLRNFDFEKLKKIYQKLCDIDAGAKTGKIDIRLALDMFVAQI